jgi:hypothetical protein
MSAGKWENPTFFVVKRKLWNLYFIEIGMVKVGHDPGRLSNSRDCFFRKLKLIFDKVKRSYEERISLSL